MVCETLEYPGSRFAARINSSEFGSAIVVLQTISTAMVPTQAAITPDQVFLQIDKHFPPRKKTVKKIHRLEMKMNGGLGGRATDQ